VTKLQAWLSIMQDGGVVDIAEEAFDTVFHYYDRQVGADGVFSINNQKYIVKSIPNIDVRAYVGLSNDKVVAEDIITHKRYEAIPFTMPSLGEFKSDKQPEGIRIREEAQELKRQFLPGEFKGIYQQREESKILPMPIRTKEEREIEDPFDVDTYPSIREAMNDFMSYLPGTFLNPNDREVIEKEIEANGLSKKFVENFALEVRAQLTQRVAM
ncbi:MAG: hypothetical protein Q8M92_07990, partial [Candidatus Subteraquimicrobiales bacterium]|nr:hypothetical protein [Candidatus Subteraquimicrobiales bacterium]